MNTRKNLWAIGAALTAALPVLSQTPAERTAARHRDLRAALAEAAPRLELRLDGGTTLVLSGGAPAAPGAIALDGGAPTPGRFDAAGRLVLTIPDAVATGFVARGFGFVPTGDGHYELRTSDVLEVAPLAPPECGGGVLPVSTPEADFSLLRIELDPLRAGEIGRAIGDRDLATAVATALNSDDDELMLKLGGKVMVPVYGVSLGGTVSFTVKLKRDGSDYLLAIGRDVAVLCGVKATEDIGVEGGVGLGCDEIYRFGSPGEVARGILDLALVQAIGDSALRLQELNDGRLREAASRLRATAAALRAMRARAHWLRSPRVEAALQRTAELRARVRDAATRAAEGARRVVGFLAEETRFIRSAVDGAEIRVSTTGEVELKIGKTAFGKVGGELGGKVAGGRQITVRLSQRYGEQPTRVEAAVSQIASAGVTAKLEIPLPKTTQKAAPKIEVSMQQTNSAKVVFERGSNGAMGAPSTSLEVKRELKIGPFGRETCFAIDPVTFARAGRDLVAVLVDGDVHGMPASVASLAIDVSVQDKWTIPFEQDLGIEKGMTAKVGLQAGWTDCGPKRETSWGFDDVVERITDFEARKAEVEQMCADLAERHLFQ